MLEAIKKYWDLFGGVITGIALTIVAKFKLEKVQLIYSVIILILVSIGILKIFKQTIEKKKNKRRETIIDKASDGYKAIKAIRLAENPTKEGEEVGKLILIIWRHLKFMLNKVKLFFDKYGLPDNMLDIGTGGGFPSVVTALAYPDIEITAVAELAGYCKEQGAKSKSIGYINSYELSETAFSISDNFKASLTPNTDTFVLSNSFMHA